MKSERMLELGEEQVEQEFTYIMISTQILSLISSDVFARLKRFPTTATNVTGPNGDFVKGAPRPNRDNRDGFNGFGNDRF